MKLVPFSPDSSSPPPARFSNAWPELRDLPSSTVPRLSSHGIHESAIENEQIPVFARPFSLFLDLQRVCYNFHSISSRRLFSRKHLAVIGYGAYLLCTRGVYFHAQKATAIRQGCCRSANGDPRAKSTSGSIGGEKFFAISGRAVGSAASGRAQRRRRRKRNLVEVGRKGSLCVSEEGQR